MLFSWVHFKSDRVCDILLFLEVVFSKIRTTKEFGVFFQRKRISDRDSLKRMISGRKHEITETISLDSHGCFITIPLYKWDIILTGMLGSPKEYLYFVWVLLMNFATKTGNTEPKRRSHNGKEIETTTKLGEESFSRLSYLFFSQRWLQEREKISKKWIVFLWMKK
jgi:hypothetical protein